MSGRTVTIEVASLEQAGDRFIKAWKTGEPQGSFITFPSVEALLTMLTVNRVLLLKVMCGAGPMSIREAARRVERDVKRVHEDVQVLLNAGVLEKTEDGQIEFPYDDVHVDFRLDFRGSPAANDQGFTVRKPGL